MEITALLIISLRLLVPLIVVRFPLIGLLASGAVDVIDYSIIGQHDWYQPVDKLLDLYYLGFCLYVALRTWRDPIARHLAVGLFAWRTVGVGLLLAGSPEWSLLFFPNLFEMLFGLYVLYRFFGTQPVLFARIRDTAVILLAIGIPKMVQELGLHLFVPYPELTPPIVAWFATLPPLIGAAAWLCLPIGALWYYSQLRDAPRLATRQPKTLPVVSTQKAGQ